MFATYAERQTRLRNPFGGFGTGKSGGFGLSSFGEKMKDVGTRYLNKMVSDKVSKGLSTLAETTGVGDVIGKENIDKGIDMLKTSIGNIF